jgi:hypothetical protein
MRGDGGKENSENGTKNGTNISTIDGTDNGTLGGSETLCKNDVFYLLLKYFL